MQTSFLSDCGSQINAEPVTHVARALRGQLQTPWRLEHAFGPNCLNKFLLGVVNAFKINYSISNMEKDDVERDAPSGHLFIGNLQENLK
ncbi:hypothetical protein NDU88_003350 [Pleurodeles waltl]|uniref:Uncharacterized protein n=1 Tax=Pleurodeles waltl TaxID=8319 RepID=A0AAV7UDT5_PLEWA|nr:hypothetical protein NDU88_003350 [Pleurodeles waltl]